MCVCARQLCNLFFLEDHQVKDTCCSTTDIFLAATVRRRKKNISLQFIKMSALLLDFLEHVKCMFFSGNTSGSYVEKYSCKVLVADI